MIASTENIKITMKNLRSFLPVLTAAALALAATAHATPAKLNDIKTISVEFKLQLQGSFTDDGTVRTYAKPTIQRLDTKGLLDILAADKYAQTNYPANFFPAGSKLALTGSGAVVVVNRNNELLVDVSDIIRIETSTNGIISGRVDNNTGLARPNDTELAITRITFDDTTIIGGKNFSFVIQGLDSIKTNDAVPNQSNGKYREVSNSQATNAAGEGQSNGTRFIITGSFKGSLNAVLQLPT